MKSSGLPHYLAFRITLIVVLLAALAGAAWWMLQPEQFEPLFTSLTVEF